MDYGKNKKSLPNLIIVTGPDNQAHGCQQRPVPSNQIYSLLICRFSYHVTYHMTLSLLRINVLYVIMSNNRADPIVGQR